jgi:transcriptional regulator with XRE-family HTH domain
MEREYDQRKTIEKIDAREIRRKLGLNQQQFWSTLGVTQSGGSRYESGRNMPKPVRELLRLVHVEQIDIKSIKREDWEVIEYLKSQEPEMYKSLKKVGTRQRQESRLKIARCRAWTAPARGFWVRRQALRGNRNPDACFFSDFRGETVQIGLAQTTAVVALPAAMTAAPGRRDARRPGWRPPVRATHNRHRAPPASGRRHPARTSRSEPRSWPGRAPPGCRVRARHPSAHR